MARSKSKTKPKPTPISITQSGLSRRLRADTDELERRMAEIVPRDMAFFDFTGTVPAPGTIEAVARAANAQLAGLTRKAGA